METRQHIAELLQQWREISQAEFKAIQAGDWPQLRDLQTSKNTLQHALTEAREAWHAENPSEPLRAQGKHSFQAEVSKLVAIEAQNVKLLQARQQKLRDRQALLRQAKSNVRRLQSSYAASARGRFSSYS